MFTIVAPKNLFPIVRNLIRKKLYNKQLSSKNLRYFDIKHIKALQSLKIKRLLIFRSSVANPKVNKIYSYLLIILGFRSPK